jgi:hypothetical protein
VRLKRKLKSTWDVTSVDAWSCFAFVAAWMRCWAHESLLPGWFLLLDSKCKVLFYGRRCEAVAEWEYNDGEEVRSEMAVTIGGDCMTPGSLDSFQNIRL